MVSKWGSLWTPAYRPVSSVRTVTPLQFYRETTFVLDLGEGLVISHAFLVADLTADLHPLGMDFLARYGVRVDLQASQLEETCCSHQMACEGEWIDDKLVN